MIIHNENHTFFYIDPTIKRTAGSVGGDGSSAANAAMDFPSTFENNVIYLVRRSDDGYFAKLPIRTTTDNVSSLVIIGMPKQGGVYWDDMPEDAKTAWLDSDVDTDYASVCMYTENNEQYTETGWNLTNCRNLTLRNLKLMRYNGYNEYWATPGWAIACSSGYGCNANIEHCMFGNMKIGEEGSELGNVSELYMPESAGSDYDPNPYDGGRFISLDADHWASICQVKDVAIYDYGTSHCIECGKKRNIIIENVEYSFRTDENSGTSAFTWGYDNNYWRAPLVHVKNCQTKMYYGTRGHYMRHFIGGYVDRIHVDGVTAGLGTTQSFAPYENRVGIKEVVWAVSRSTGSSIKNITCNYPDFHGGSGHLVSFNYTHSDGDIRTPQQEQYTEIKNITINMCSVENAKYANDSHNDNGGNNFNSSNGGLLYLVRGGNYDRLVSSDFLVSDVHLNGLRSNVASFDCCILDLQDIDIVGNVHCWNCVGKIKSITSWYPGYILRDAGCNLLYIGKFTCNLTNTVFSYNRQPAIITNGNSHILVHEVNGNCWTSDYWNPEYPHSYICTNDGVAGNYTCRTGRSKCQTWSAYNNQTDTGCSLKFTNESGDDWHWPMRVGNDPFKGITKAVQAGSYNAIFYLALYGYNIRFNEIKDRMFIRIKLPNGNYVYSSAGICSLDEDTVWTNIEGTTNYKFVIPIDIDTAGDIEIDFTWSFYMEGGVTLLDPYPKLVARS